MRHPRFVLFTAAAIAVTAVTAAPARAAVPARSPKPADVATATVVKTISTDVNGDGARDTATLTYLGNNTFRLSATTTKGKTASATFTSRVNEDADVPAVATWYGASTMDGRKGSELIVNRYLTANGDSSRTSLRVYSWRSGKLVVEKAPSSPWGRTWQVGTDGKAKGYRFFSKGGHRYVDASQLSTPKYKSTPWNGKITRSIWRHGSWVKVSTRKAATVKGDLTLWSQVSFGGPRLLLEQLRTDVSGDGIADLVSVHQDKRAEYYAVTVDTGSTTSTQTFRAEADWFVGAAGVDGVAGSELIFETEAETPLWTVLTWRSGKLAILPAPATGQGAGTWSGGGDDASGNINAGVVDGRHYVTRTILDDQSEPYTADISTWVWDGAGWTAVSVQTDVPMTQDQAAAIDWQAFTADDLVRP